MIITQKEITGYTHNQVQRQLEQRDTYRFYAAQIKEQWKDEFAEYATLKLFYSVDDLNMEVYFKDFIRRNPEAKL